VALGSAAIFSSRKAEVPAMQTFGNAIRPFKETKTRNIDLADVHEQPPLAASAISSLSIA
jgi:hypothetical protein